MTAPEIKASSLRSIWKKNRLFWVIVVFPTILAVLYFGLIASDVYISESRFIVRSPERQNASPLGMLLKGSGFSRAQDDSYSVQDYILSRDAVHAVNEKIDLRAAFGKGDIFGRFPGLDGDDSFENMHIFYKKVVNVRLDSLSSIGTLSVRAFSAKEARDINAELLRKAEELVNQLNERGRQDLIRFADQEVAKAEEKAKSAALTLAKYRNSKGVIDPEKQSSIPLQQIAKIQDELISSKALLSQLQISARDNPQIPLLKNKIRILENEIQSENQKITGGDRSLASKAADFQRLALDKEFADRQLASAMASLEQARNEAQRQQLYLERIAQPSLPDIAMEPRRFKSILITMIACIVLWGIMSLLLAGVREHHD